MPVTPQPLWQTPNSTTIQDVVNYVKSFPGTSPLQNVSGYNQEPAISFANDIMQRILAQDMNWKWSQTYLPAVLTVALQQDYVTQITDISWIEYGRRIDINNSTNNGNLAPKPVWPLEGTRQQPRTSWQGVPLVISFVPNRLAFMGSWTANTNILCAYGVAQVPISPIQQFVDVNGNILYIDSTQLGLTINSPGFTQVPIPLPEPNPYGTTGTVQPEMPPNASPGQTVLDGSVTWTVADPNGYAVRLGPLSAYGGVAWLIEAVYQKKAPKLISLQQNISPIPDEYTYLFREGMLSKCQKHSGDPKYKDGYAEWEETLVAATRAADREQSNDSFYPSEGLGGGVGTPGMVLGPGYPYGAYPGA